MLSGEKQAYLLANKASTPEIKLVSGRIELIRRKSTLSGATLACYSPDKGSTPHVRLVSAMSGLSVKNQRCLA